MRKLVLHKEKQKGNKVLCLLLSLALVLNTFSHFIEHVLGIGNTFWFSYLIWAILFLFGFMIKNKPSKGSVLSLCFLVISSFLPILSGDPFDSISELHMTIMIWVAFYFAFCMRFKSLSNNNLIFVYKTIAFLGCISCLYAMIVQSSVFISLLRGIDTQYNSWLYVSFYRQRNIFGGYCFLSSVACLYLYYVTRNKLYMALLCLNGLQVFLLDSRASLLSFLMLIIIPFYIKSNFKKWFVVVFSILIIGMFFLLGGTDGLIERFSHQSVGTPEGEIDSGVVRLLMWQACFNYLNINMGWIWGFGTGSVGKYLTPIFGMGSSHSAYFDSLFDGGLIYLLIISVPLFYSLKAISQSKDENYKNLHLGACISYIFYNFMEAGMAPFASNFFSVTATLLFITIPLNYKGYLTTSPVK